MDSVKFVVQTCRERGISIRKLESDLGFSNGYIRKLKKGAFPYDRLKQIAAYLDVPLDYLASGGEKTLDLSAKTAHLTAKILTDRPLIDALEKYFTLSESQKQHVISTIDTLFDAGRRG